MAETVVLLGGLYAAKVAITWPIGSWIVAKLKSRPVYAVIKPLCKVERGHRHPKAELRTYAAFVVAEVTVDGADNATKAAAEASKLLKRYIGGDYVLPEEEAEGDETAKTDGKKHRKHHRWLAISSLQRSESATLAAAAPGTDADADDADNPDESKDEGRAEDAPELAAVEEKGTSGASSFTISFVLPKKHTMASLPKPRPPIKLRLVEPEIVASYRFRGNSPTDVTVAEMAEKLKALLVEHGFKTDGKAVLTQYHPKRAPRWMRINEARASMIPAHTLLTSRAEVLLRVTNYSEKFGQDAENEAKQAANAKVEQSDEELSEAEDEPLKGKAQNGQ